jgi:predicted RNA-binding protein associated with RNAse of E/G family
MSVHLNFTFVGTLDHETKVFLTDVDELRAGTRVAQISGGFSTNEASQAFLDLVGIGLGQILPDLTPFFEGALARGTITRENLEAAYNSSGPMEELLEAQRVGLDVYATWE